MPYLDAAVEARSAGSDAAGLAEWATNAHWGLFPSADEPVGAAELVAATKRMNELICARIAEGDAVLDVGCGFGGMLHYLNGRMHQGLLVGVNIDLRQLSLRQEHPDAGGATGWVCADGCRLPVRSASFDVALSVESAFHMESRAALFREVRRVLKGNGRLVVADFLVDLRHAPRGTKLADFVDARRVLDDFFGHSPAGLVSRSAYERHARANGMRIDEDHDVSRQVMPSFASVSEVYERSGAPEPVRETSLRAIGQLERLMDDGLVQYHVVSFVASR